MDQSKIYHGGSMGRGSGFNAGAAPAPAFNKERIWLHPSDMSALIAFPPNGPNCRALPTTINTCVWVFVADQLDLAFSWFPVPSKFWTYDLTAPTNCDLRFYWYTDNTSANIIAWRAELNYVRNGETLNFAPPALGTRDVAAGTQYLLHVEEFLNFPINNPSGSALTTEGMFYFKMGRDGAAAADTFEFEAYLLGASIDFPLA
jgi:hypothetical protein